MTNRPPTPEKIAERIIEGDVSSLTISEKRQAYFVKDQISNGLLKKAIKSMKDNQKNIPNLYKNHG